MKMVMAVVTRDQADKVLNQLIEAGHSATFLDSRGGTLRQSQLTLFIALDPDQVDNVLAIVRGNLAREVTEEGREPGQAGAASDVPVEEQGGRAAVFVWDLGRFELY